ncbi:MAG: AAA family ATPase [Microthrixaceae bacterium]
MSGTPTAHLMCGLVATGKTTLARRLATDLSAVRLSRDEWMLRLHGGRFDDPTYLERLGPCTDLMWDVAFEITAAGSSVILDWNFWSRDRRSDAHARAHAHGISVVVHWVDVPLEVAVERAAQRVSETPTDSHLISAEEVRHFATIFEPPAEAEGFIIERHG